MDGNPSDNNSEELPACTSHVCDKDDDIYKLECGTCKRLVHYRCTQLPLYQLQLFVTKYYRGYKCVNCIDVQKYLADLLPEQEAEQNHYKILAELAIAQAGLKQKEEEHNAEKIKTSKFAVKLKCLQTDLKKQTDSAKKYRIEVKQLQIKIDQYEQSLGDSHLGEKKLNNTINNLQNELEEQQEKFESYEDSELYLKAQISKHKKDLKNQEEMFNEAGNPEYDKFANLEQSMNIKLDILGKTLHDSLTKQMEDNGNTLRELLSHQLSNKLNEVTKTYAQSITNDQGSETMVPTPVQDIRSIMQEQNNQRLVEENDQKTRSCNIIVHRVEEPTSDDKDQAKKSDEEFFSSLRESIGVDVTVKSISRIGKLDRCKKRPIKVVLQSEVDKNKIMQNLKNLKDKAEYKNISVSEDYTVAERESIRKIAEEVKDKNSQEPADSRYIYKIRGTPKNGLHMKRFLKRV